MKVKDLKDGMKALSGGTPSSTPSKDEVRVQEAKDFLESKGFYVHNLWQVEDVQINFECTDKQAQEVLHDALTNEYISERIFNEITDYATMNGFVSKNDK
jgi:hypothetical protein